MKKSLLIAITACSFFFSANNHAQATVWVVNSGGIGDFTNAQDAITAATAGDTLYFVGSPVSYGNFTVTKPLTLIGPGYFLNENPNAYVNKYSPQIGTITIESDNPTDGTRDLNSGAAGTRLIGIQSTYLTVRVNNVTVDRCKIYYLQGQGNDTVIPANITVTRSYVEGYISDVINSTFENTIFPPYGQAMYDVEGCLIKNCDLGYVYTAEALNSIFLNCRFYYSNEILHFQDANNVRHCVFNNADPSANAEYTAGTNNIFSVPEASFYIDPQPTALDAKKQLHATSPGIGAGEGGVNVGAFGGASPYVLSGIPPIPAVYEITAPSAVNAPDGLPVTIKVRANN
ncbi:MAG TPA: hypothetical protein VD927_14210 [Chryseosolibacter sp.]|nr:hypothetical protein [Chryseosolibacter sp.]